MLHLLLYLALEPVKRVLSAVLYPVAYRYAEEIRQTLLQLRPGLLGAPSSVWTAFWWLLLDDSVWCSYGWDFAINDKYYPAWILKRGPAWRAWWWSAVRNSFVNWNNLNAVLLGNFISEDAHAGKRNFFITRVYANGRRPYCEFWLFGRWNQVGWLSGDAPRFEIDIMKRRA